jgi:hypothetical protein
VWQEIRLQFESLAALRRVRRQLRRIDDLRVLVAELDDTAGTKAIRDDASSTQLVRATDRSLRLLGPRIDSCVPRSLTLLVLWSRRGRPASFVSGVNRDGGELRGHAWLEAPDLDARLGGQVESPAPYAEIFRYASRSAPRLPTTTN